MTKSSGRDFLDEITENFTSVIVQGRTVTLSLPKEANLVKIRAHVALKEDERLKFPGGNLGWSNAFLALALAATVQGVRVRSIEEWELVIAATSDGNNMSRLCANALSLCGYPAKPDAVEPSLLASGVDKLGDAVGTLPS